jgi:glycosyltransferase involved in cell wall biosynthesis
MRLLHLDTGREMRGGQWQALLLMEQLRATGVPGTLLAPGKSPLLEQALARSLPVEPFSWPALYRLSRQVDLVHCHDARAHTLAAVASGAPFVVSRRVGFPVKAGPASQWKYSRAACYLAVSAYVRDKLLQAGVPEAKIRVVYDGVDSGAVPEPAAVRDRIVAPATEDPRKGSELLREAARLAGVEIEFSSALSSALGRARLFVYITHDEGLGSALLLAMAAGVPVVASRVGGIPEIVRHEETGLLTGNSPQEVAAAIRRLLDDGALAQRLAEGGRNMVESGFTMKHLALNTLTVYQEVLA